MHGIDMRRIGERIKAIRRARGINQTDLAKALGLSSPRAISELENGKRELRGSEVYALCSRLECTLAELFGLEADPLQTRAGACLRAEDAKNQELKQVVQRAQRQSKLLGELEDILGEKPSSVLPSLDKNYPLSKSGDKMREQAIELAGWARNRLGLEDGPLDLLENKLENSGVIWTTWSLPEGVSGLSLRCNERPFIIVESGEHAQRQRFSLAHELAHILVDAAEHAVLTRSYAGNGKWGYSFSENKERRANHFAGVFLMPESSIRAFARGRFTLKSLGADEIMRLATHFKVSYQAAALALAHLGFLPWARYREMKDYQQVSGGTPLVTGPQPEFFLKWAAELQATPRILRLVVEALEKDLVTYSRACELVMADPETLDSFLIAYGEAQGV